MTEATLPKGTADVVVEKLFPTPNPWMKDPAGWVGQELGEHMWSGQAEICQSVVENRYTAVRSCHGTGKSYTASRIMSWWIDQHPPGEAFVVSTAPSQTQVEAILWREVGRAHQKGDLVGRITSGMVPQWKIGQEIVGFGRKPQDLKSKEEAMAAFQGIHAKYVLVVIDEAGGVPKWLFDAVDTLVTNTNSRVLAIGNPDDSSSEFEKVCRAGSGWKTIKISYDMTPAFTGEEVSESLLEDLISETWVEERRKRWGETSPLFISKVLAEFPDISDDTLFSPALIRMALETELDGLEKGQFAADIARYGSDETCIYRNRGGNIRLEKSAHKQDTMVTAGWISALLQPHMGGIRCVVDADGLGGPVYDRLRELGMAATPFENGAKAHDPRRFANRKSEMYWVLREGMEAGEVDLDPEDEDLLAQLGSIRFKYTSKGQIQVESKEEMKKRGLPSPDRADAVMMAMLPGGVMKPDHARKHRKKAKAKSLTSGLMKKRM